MLQKLYLIYAFSYLFRAYSRWGNGDKQRAVKYFQKAIDIYRTRGRLDIADQLLVPLSILQNQIKEEQENQYQTEIEDEPKAK